MPPLPPASHRRSSRRLPAAVVLVPLALTATLLVAAPAAAHPFLRGGGEVPVDSSATITLDLAHGCGSEADGTGGDTLEVALEVPAWLRVLAVTDHPVYRHDLEVAEGRPAVVTWTAVGTAEPAPVFELDVVATGTAGEARHLAVFQGCADRSHRWIGTPDAPAEDPAINVRLTAADPSRPAPPETPIEQVPDGPGPDGPGPDEPSPDQPAGPDGASDGAATGEDGSVTVTGAQGDEDNGGSGGDGLLSAQGGIGLLAAAAVSGSVVLALSRRGRRDTGRGTPS